MSDKEIIKNKLRFNDLAYGRMVYDNGLLWIDRYFHGDETVQEVIQRSALYWAWWKQQWSLRDSQFIYETSLRKQDRLDGSYLLAALDLYYDIHKVRNLTIIPNRFVINEISKILKEQLASEEQKVKQLTNEK